ncbi:MAG: tetratricopeptide repeat protein [Candidatus Eisenbacteria bacterium]|nr:tetratricopeptide repeat protein [Candidatus Eisenbacteria bacterium]
MMGLLRGRGVRQAACLLVAASLFTGGVCLRRHVFGDPVPPGGQELMYFPSGKFLKQSALGHTTTLADVAWLRAIQYYGHHRLTDRKYDMVGHIFDVITTLDPNFIHAYVFGAVVLSQDAGRPDDGLALLRKGMRANPDNWLLAFETGFIYYVILHDYDSAGRYFALSSRLPGAPDMTSRFAAFVHERAGHSETALELWSEIARATDNKFIKEMAEEKMEKLRAQLRKERDTPPPPEQG